MSFNIIDKIRSRSREAWVKLVKDKWIDLRIFVQENGELGFISAFVLGIVFILFFKFLISLLIITSLAFFLIWNIAEPAESTGNISKGAMDPTSSSDERPDGNNQKNEESKTPNSFDNDSHNHQTH